jgi:myo-inositol-1(or 4)-monophosphatase
VTAASAEPTDRAALATLATEIALEVAERLRTSLLGDGPAISSKSTPTDLVTELDTWSEGHITARILGARPHDGIKGEEGVDVVGTSGVTWSIDPIDGTVNFVHGIPGFCVSIAAMEGGQTVAGVVVSPMHREVFRATLGGGATLDGSPIHCAEPVSVARAVVATGFGYDPARRTRQAEVVTRVISQLADIRRFGAAALDLCWVACGRVDAYWEVGLNHWDHAAGALIAREAGAIVTGATADTEPSERFTLAAPPAIWAELAEILQAADATSV